MNKIYEGKYFYEIVKTKSGGIMLTGPHDNIYYAIPHENQEIVNPYKFVQVIDGRVMQGFTDEEILVTDKKL